MQLSERLRAVADMVTPGYYLADIGTDHAYIPIYLVSSGIIPGAIAADVNPGPLERAQEHIIENNLQDRIETRLSDGLRAIAPDEAESVIIAGMGGALTIKILREGETRLADCRELILQPQSEISSVRAFLDEGGWIIERENMVCEDGKYYPMMRAVHGISKTPLTQLQLLFGPELLKQHNPVLLAYLRREEAVQGRILESLQSGSSEKAVQREQEIRRKRGLIEEALNSWEEKA